MAALRAEAQVAQDPLAIGNTIGWLNLRIMELREPLTRQVALDELLDWLIDDEPALPDDEPALLDEDSVLPDEDSSVRESVGE